MPNPYQTIIDTLRACLVWIQYNGNRDKAVEYIDLAMKYAITHLWIETELYTIKEMLEESEINYKDIASLISNLIRDLRGEQC